MGSTCLLCPVFILLLIFCEGALSAQVSCEDGYAYNNMTFSCEDINECSITEKSPCVKGSCENAIGGFYCICPSGRFGQTCSSFTETSCGSNPAPGCQNGGTCIGSICTCMEGYYGDFCDYKESSDCPMLCRNNGVCVDNSTTSSPFCLCPYGFRGEYCQYELDLCAQNESVCLNNGTCRTNVNTPCDCTEMYTGTYCEHKINETVTTCGQCQSGSTCENDGGSLSCKCSTGFTGTFCQYSSVCNVCSKGALCVPSDVLAAKSRCVCPEGTSGINCENDEKDECASSPCLHGGTCINNLGYYSCNCSGIWYGVNCEMNNTICTGKYESELGQELWTDCPMSSNCTCLDSAFNDKCDATCNSEACLFDLFACTTNGTCSNDMNCMTEFDNNNCSMECKESNCGSDGMDCVDDKRYPNVVLGTLVFDILAISNISDMVFFSNILPYQLSTFLKNPVFFIRRFTTGSEPGTGALMINNKTTDERSRRYDVYYNVANNPDCGSNSTYPCWTNIKYISQYTALYLSRNPEVYTGYMIKKITTCMDGYWGEDCMNMCSSFCNNTYDRVCNMIDGECNHGCMSGYSGGNCTTKCSENCLNSEPSCNATTGECWAGTGYRCKAGYMGLACDEECSSGTYGEDCSKNCSTNCNQACNKMDGSCVCKAGYTGTSCVNSCATGYYGQNCSMKCNTCRYSATCDPVTGNCSQCPSGKAGNMCENDCPNKTYGFSCAKTCSSNCLNMECNKVNGDCYQCISGYQGTTCQSPIITDTSSVVVDYSSTVIAVIIVLVILIIVALFIAYFLWRRSQGGEYDVDDDKKVEDQPLKDMKPNQNGGSVDNAVVGNGAGMSGGGGGEKHPLIAESDNIVDLDTVETRPTSLAPGGVFVGEDNSAEKEGEGETLETKTEETTDDDSKEDSKEESKEENKEESKEENKEESKEDSKDDKEEDSAKADDEDTNKNTDTAAEEDKKEEDTLPPPTVNNDNEGASAVDGDSETPRPPSGVEAGDTST